jgi:hypothetical protein
MMLTDPSAPARAQVRGVARFSGQLSQAAAHFAQCLCPTARRVSHQRDVQALIAEVLRHRDRGVDAGLPRRHGHVGRIGDDHRAFHQRTSSARILESRKLIENLRHFVAALAAADVHDHVRIAPLGQGFLHHGLAGPEAAGDCGAATARNRE